MQTVFFYSQNRELTQAFASEASLENATVVTERRVEALKGTLLNTEMQVAVIDISHHPQGLMQLCHDMKRGYVLEGIRLILILPERDEDRVVEAFQAGADDCMFYPVRPRELVARIKAVLRRGYSKPVEGRKPRVIRIGNMEIHNDEYKVYVDGEALDLTRSEYRILHVLASHPKRVYTRQQLLDHCGNARDDTKGRSVDVHVRALRMKLGKQDKLIKTARGIGYYFEKNEPCA